MTQKGRENNFLGEAASTETCQRRSRPGLLWHSTAELKESGPGEPGPLKTMTGDTDNLF